MRSGLLVTILLLAACDGSRVHPADGALSVAPYALALPDAFVGFPTQASVTVSNAGLFPRTATLTLTGPFSIDQDQLVVPAATDVPLAVRFDALAAGDATGQLTLTSESATLTVTLSARATAPPTCTPSGSCTDSTFDAAQGRCIDVALADGAVCLSGAACLVNARCEAGACVGEVRSCDDGNPCTADACDPQQGCQHFDGLSSCPAPADLCHAATCDPLSGCGIALVADGTACGPADCGTAHVCMQGSCQVRPVPDGTVCGTATPCQPAGACRAQACVQPDPTALVPAWSYWPPNNAMLHFTGLADIDGNLYWTECSGTCSLTSATPGGVIRYRTPLGSSFQTAEPIIADGMVLLGWNTWVRAFRTSDGAEQWSFPVTFSALPAYPTALVDLGLNRIAALTVEPSSSTTIGRSRLFGIDTAIGAERWISTLAPNERGVGAVSDEAGNVWVSVTGPAGQQLVELDPLYGLERARLGATDLSFVAEANGQLATTLHIGSQIGGLQLLSTATGATTTLPAQGWWVGDTEPLLTATGAWLVARTTPCTRGGPCVPGEPPWLAGFSLPSGAPTWNVDLSTPGAVSEITAPLLAANGDLLVASSPVTTQPSPLEPQLHAVTASGAPRFTCPLPGPGVGTQLRYHGATLLSHGQWIVAGAPSIQCQGCLSPAFSDVLMAFDLPGYALEPHGWTTLHGNAQRSGRPR